MKNKISSCIRNSALLVACVCVLGCDGVLSRSRPSQEKYLAQYIPEIPRDKITRLDYTYQASVGGYMSLAKVEVADVSKLAPLWSLPEDMVLRFDTDSRDLEVQFINMQFTVADANNSKCIPAWVNLSYSKPLYVHKDATGRRRHRKFFLSKDSPVFYLIVSGD